MLSLLQIIGINIVLSGDNAVVIALAARNLPPQHQKKAILWGSGGAVVLRIILTLGAVFLLDIPYLQVVGGLFLLWIAIKLLIDDEHAEEGGTTKTGLGAAIRTILIADVVMSLDNVLAIAGAARGSWLLIVVGLAVSIPLVIFGSNLIIKLMNRFPIIVYLGAGLIGWTAGEMVMSDKGLIHLAEGQIWLHNFLEFSHKYLVLPIVFTLLVIGVGWLIARGKSKKADADHS